MVQTMYVSWKYIAVGKCILRTGDKLK